MIINILYKIVPTFFIEAIKKQGFNDGVKFEKENQQKDKERKQEDKLLSFEFRNPLNSLIISMPNEEVNPVVGKIIRYELFANEPFIIVYDYISQQEVTLMSNAYQYTDEMMSALMKMTAQERHVVFYGHTKNFASKEELIPNLEKMNEILSKNGFFEELKLYKESKNEQ
jgi:hypothetical protein